MRSIALDRRASVAFLATLLFQAGIGIWWASEQGSLLRFHQQRLDIVEARQSAVDRQQVQLMVRLARIEERQVAQGQQLSQLLQDIKTLINKH